MSRFDIENYRKMEDHIFEIIEELSKIEGKEVIHFVEITARLQDLYTHTPSSIAIKHWAKENYPEKFELVPNNGEERAGVKVVGDLDG